MRFKTHLRFERVMARWSDAVVFPHERGVWRTTALLYDSGASIRHHSARKPSWLMRLLRDSCVSVGFPAAQQNDAHKENAVYDSDRKILVMSRCSGGDLRADASSRR